MTTIPYNEQSVRHLAYFVPLTRETWKEKQMKKRVRTMAEVVYSAFGEKALRTFYGEIFHRIGVKPTSFLMWLSTKTVSNKHLDRHLHEILVSVNFVRDTAHEIHVSYGNLNDDEFGMTYEEDGVIISFRAKPLTIG